jgi:hypothetical protein
LTWIRRPGTSPYNTQTFPVINRFYENRTNTYNAAQTIPSESIQVVADTASVIYDATGPSTKTALFNKSVNGSAYFQSVGNSLYFTDGVDLKKYLTPSLIWGPDQSFTLGQWVVDSNNNIQEVTSTSSASPEVFNVTNVVSVAHPPGTHRLVTITFNANFPTPEPASITLAGLTAPFNTYDGVWDVTSGIVSFSGNQLVLFAGSGPMKLAESLRLGMPHPAGLLTTAASSGKTWGRALRIGRLLRRLTPQL